VDRIQRDNGSVAGFARWKHLCEIGCVRVGFSNADPYQSTARVASRPAKTQSERDLDLPEAAGWRAEGRASGMSGAARSDRRETCGGAVAVAVCNLPTTPPFAPNGFVSGRSEGSIAIIGGECDVCN
jgi:hypothetical protein